MGKNTLLITKEFGSFVFLGEIVLDISLSPDNEIEEDLCGNCTRCIDACPTGALCDAYTLDARKCLSYLTIEHKGVIEKAYREKMGDFIFGCDICQDVCPHNRKAQTTNEQHFLPSSAFESLTKHDWQTMEEAQFRQLFGKSPLKRAKLSGLKRNIGE